MTTILKITPHDPLVARDGRPFGAGQGNRMRGLPWPLPSVVAGSFRTALVKGSGDDFSGTTPSVLLEKVSVAGVLPCVGSQLYLPAPQDAVVEKNPSGNGLKMVHRVSPQPLDGGCDLPEERLLPVMLSESQATDEFKPEAAPAWWPISKYVQWLTGSESDYRPTWFDETFLQHPLTTYRDHVALDSDRGAAAESLLFASANLHVGHLPRYLGDEAVTKLPFDQRLAEVSLTARANIDHDHWRRTQVDWLHPLGGEQRLVKWRQCGQAVSGWTCPPAIESALADASRIRLILATPAIFASGWKPGWLHNGLQGEFNGIHLKLVGVANGRWKAVSGWSLADTKDQPRGPKAIRRMVPEGSVYYFTCEPGAAANLKDHWLEPVSDAPQERRDGFGLAVWGTW